MSEARPTVLITGATGGFGRAVARQLARDGFALVLNYRSNHGAARELAAELGDQGSSAMLLPGDLLDENAIHQILDGLPVPLFGLVHTAVDPLGESHFLRADQEAFVRQWRIAVAAPAAILRSLLPAMVEARRGSVIWLLTSAILGPAPKYLSAYVSAKMAALGLMRSLAAEYASKGIRFNAVSPGFTETELTGAIPSAIKNIYVKQIPMGHFGTPEDIAACVSYLFSEQAAFVTGINIPVTGGAGLV